ncbi:MAG: gas vesicle protein GvpG [Eubacteriales bacterium]
MSLLIKLAEIIKDEVDKELYGPASIKKQLAELEQRLNLGEITEEEYEEREGELLDLLAENQGEGD